MLMRRLLRVGPGWRHCDRYYHGDERNQVSASEAPRERNDVHGPPLPINTRSLGRAGGLDAELGRESEEARRTFVENPRQASEDKVAGGLKRECVHRDDGRRDQRLRCLLNRQRIVNRRPARVCSWTHRRTGEWWQRSRRMLMRGVSRRVRLVRMADDLTDHGADRATGHDGRHGKRPELSTHQIASISILHAASECQKLNRVATPKLRGWFVKYPIRALVPRSWSNESNARSSVTLLTKKETSHVSRRTPARRLTRS